MAETLSLALQHHQAGRLQEAEAAYRLILQSQPSHPDALHLLGVISYQQGRADLAIEYISQAIAINARSAEYYNNLGVVYQAVGKPEHAAAQYREALALRPAYAQASYSLGTVYQAQGKPAEAEAQYRQTLAVQPDHAIACCKLGDVLKEQSRFVEAVAQYRLALVLNAGYTDAYNNLGIALMGQGKFDEAETCYRQALALQPAYAEVHNNLGNALREQGKQAESIAEFRRSLALKPDCAAACYNLGLTLGEQGNMHEAAALCRQALALKSDYFEAENRLMYHMQHLGDWMGLDKLVERQKQLIRAQSAPSLSPLTFLAIPTSAAEQLACARNWAAGFALYVQQRESLGFCFSKSPKPRLRIGYLSADLRQHPVACLIAELFELHDRSRVEVVAYCIGVDDGSELRKRLVRACDRFVDLTALSYVEAACAIHKDGIDLLIDLQGYTQLARTPILALRPAPIQVNWLGYPGTMGAEFMDYIITDRFITPPDHAPFFSEKLVSLPDCYQINDRKRQIARKAPTRRACRLPARGLVFCCFNSTNKIMAPVFDVWMRLLRAVEGSVLWLLEANSGTIANLRREASVRGVAPERLVFAPRASLDSHLARHRLADLFLDTVPYNAHVTASDALWAGLPVLTCSGETFASRVAGSLLTSIGLPELITYSLSDYEARALQLARNPSELAGLRERLSKNRLTMPLFDSERFTRHLERAYQMMWDIYANGDAPRRIEVPRRGTSRRVAADA